MNKSYPILVICVLTRSYLSVVCLNKIDFDNKYNIADKSSSSDFILNHEPEMRGSFGGVFRVDLLKGSSTQKYIVKKPLLKTAEEIEDFIIELEYIKKMGSSNLGPEFFDCFQENDNRFVVMESLPCTFNTLISNPKQPSGVIPVRKSICEKNFTDLPAGVQFFYIWQMIKVLAQIHDQGYVHHDIKPDNMGFTTSGIEVKYLDFGMMCKKDKITVGGTPQYMHPLKLSFIGYDEDKKYPQLNRIMTNLRELDQTNSDIWSLGMTIVSLLKPKVLNSFNPDSFSTTDLNKARYQLRGAILTSEFDLIKGDHEFNKLVHSMTDFANSSKLPSLRELDKQMDEIYLTHWVKIQKDRQNHFCEVSPEFKDDESKIRRRMQKGI